MVILKNETPTQVSSAYACFYYYYFFFFIIPYIYFVDTAIPLSKLQEKMPMKYECVGE